jgi:uncharacterized Zn-binding protein involved in type VI secretion
MRAAARGNGADRVFSLTGSGYDHMFPTMTTTGPSASTVLINNIPAVVVGDIVGFHFKAGKAPIPDTSPLTTGSSKVFINGRAAGRIGDQYTSDNFIISGSHNVFIGDTYVPVIVPPIV